MVHYAQNQAWTLLELSIDTSVDTVILDISKNTTKKPKFNNKTIGGKSNNCAKNCRRNLITSCLFLTLITLCIFLVIYLSERDKRRPVSSMNFSPVLIEKVLLQELYNFP